MTSLYKLFNDKYKDITIIPGSPVLYIEEFNSIVFSDLHLGFEESVARGLDYTYGRKSSYSLGMYIPRIQLRKILNTLDEVFKSVKPRKVIINGDVKHAFDRLLKQEREEIEKLINYLIEKGVDDIVIIRGNHDNFLKGVLKRYGVELSIGYELHTSDYSVLITHGHLDLNPYSYDLVIIGHEHPSMRCLGYYKTPVFMKIPLKNSEDKYIIVLPAIGPYHPGTQVTLDTSMYLSPIIKKYGDLSNAKILLWFKISSDTYVDELQVLEHEPMVYTLTFFKELNVLIIEFNRLSEALDICSSLT